MRLIVLKHDNFYRQIATWHSVNIVLIKIQVEYLMLICYNKQWNEIHIFLTITYCICVRKHNL